MSPARQSFKDPSPDLPTQAKKSVEALLSTVSEARKTLGEPTALDRKVVDRDLGVILADFHFDGRQQGAKRPKLDEQPRTSLSALARAYARLTVHASLKTHCLTAFPWEEAIRIAEQRDKELAEGTIQAEKLPLLGLFFSIKDCIYVKGFDTTLGCSNRTGKPEPASAWIVERLEALGGILIAKTACPQAMVANTTHSPLWGAVRSPFGDDFPVGGSSGGEAALVKLGGSAVGIGTDMGGSVRAPAALSGLFGLKVSSTRLPFHSTVDFLTGLPGLAEPATAPGILARHSESIPVLMDALSNAPSVPGAPRVDQAGEIKHWSLDNLISGRPLRVGVAFREASPALHAALARVSEALGKQPNIEVVPFQIPEKMWKEIAPLWGDLASVAGFKDGLEMVGDDPLIPESLLDPNAADLPSSVACSRHLRLLRFSRSFRAALGPIDILLNPGYALPVHPSSLFAKLGNAETWFMLFNLLDWPGMTLPLPLDSEGRTGMYERAYEEQALTMWKEEHTGEEVQEKFEMMRRKAGDPAEWKVQDGWTTDGQHANVAAPVSVQIVGRPGTEELLCDFAQLIRRLEL